MCVTHSLLHTVYRQKEGEVRAQPALVGLHSGGRRGRDSKTPRVGAWHSSEDMAQDAAS